MESAEILGSVEVLYPFFAGSGQDAKMLSCTGLEIKINSGLGAVGVVDRYRNGPGGAFWYLFGRYLRCCSSSAFYMPPWGTASIDEISGLLTVNLFT